MAYTSPSADANFNGIIEKLKNESRASRIFAAAVHFDRPDSRACFSYRTSACRKPSQQINAKIDVFRSGRFLSTSTTRRSRRKKSAPVCGNRTEVKRFINRQ